MNKLLNSIKNRPSLPSYLLVGLFFIALLTTGLFAHKDYGISWDEPIGKTNGALSALYANYKLDYLFLSKEKVDILINKFGDTDKANRKYTNANYLYNYKDKEYGVIFECYLAAIQILSNTVEEQLVYQQRHLLTFIFFFTGVIVFYLIGKIIFKNWKLALLACLFLVFSPRIFAHSFYNPKDIPFMSVYIWTIYSMLKFLKEKNIKWALIHAFTTAILIAVRIPGIIIPAITLMFLVIDEITGSFLNRLKQQRWSAYIVYFFFLPILIVLFWPYLWEHPIDNFVDAFYNFSRFRSDTYLLFWGEIIWTKDLPWYYTYSWMLITTPILYTMLFFIGGFFLLKDIYKKRKAWRFYTYETTRNKLLVVVTFLGPLAAIFIYNSVLYNGWRHSYFIYPSMLLIAVNALPKLVTISKSILGVLGKKLIVTVLCIYISYIAYVTYQLHPYQQDYFNCLAGQEIHQNFDIDYWGLSNKEGIGYLIEKEGTQTFSIGTHIKYPVILNTNNFTQKERRSIQINTIDAKSDYLFIGSNERYKFSKIQAFDLSNYRKIKIISAGNVPLLEIYKRK